MLTRNSKFSLVRSISEIFEMGAYEQLHYTVDGVFDFKSIVHMVRKCLRTIAKLIRNPPPSVVLNRAPLFIVPVDVFQSLTLQVN